MKKLRSRPWRWLVLVHGPPKRYSSKSLLLSSIPARKKHRLALDFRWGVDLQTSRRQTLAYYVIRSNVILLHQVFSVLSSLGTDNSPTYPLDGDPHLLLRQVHRCNICLLRIQVISLCERLAGQDAKVTTVPVGVLKTTRLLTRLFQWTTDVADRLAFSEVSLYVNLWLNLLTHSWDCSVAAPWTVMWY